MGYINPVLKLPAAQRLLALPPEQRELLAQLFTELRHDANREAENAWRRRKGPMASYWRATSTYCRHTAHALRQKPAADGRGPVPSETTCKPSTP